MKKYIDVEKLIALIDAKLEDLGMSGSVWVGRSVLRELKDDITSLQQEQDILILNKKDWEKQEQFRKDKKFGIPLQQEQPDVDFEKELDRIWFDEKFGDNFDNSAVDFANVRWICNYFYELGKNVRKEE